MNVVQVRLEMTPTDSNLDVDHPFTALESPSGLSSFIGNSLQKAAHWAGEIFNRKDKAKVLSPPVILLDVQRHEPKGLIGITMRVIRRRFFNLWARPPPSWTNAVSYSDPAVPGTFVSRRRTRLPATVKNEESPRESKSKFRRARNAVRSTFLSLTWPIRKLASGRLGQDYSETDKDGNADPYLMHSGSSSQRGIFDRSVRDDDDEDPTAEKSYENPGSISSWSPAIRFISLIGSKDSSVVKLPSWPKKEIEEEYSEPNWLPWNRKNILQSNLTNIQRLDNNEIKGGWGISGYFNGEGESDFRKNRDIVNDLQDTNYHLSIVNISTTAIKAVGTIRVIDGIKELFSSVIEISRNFLSPHLEIIEPFQTLKSNGNIDMPENSNGIALNYSEKNESSESMRMIHLSQYSGISGSSSDSDDSGDSDIGEILLGKNIPLWRWMIPDNVIADSIVDFGDSVKNKIWNVSSNTLFPMTEKDELISNIRGENTTNSPENSVTAFSYLYDGIAKTTSLISQTITDGSSSVADNLVAFVVSPPWDAYYKGAIPFLDINSTSAYNGGTADISDFSLSTSVNGISMRIGSFGDEVLKGVLSVGVFVGLRKENVVSLVMDQDHSEQPLVLDIDDSVLDSIESSDEYLDINNIPWTNIDDSSSPPSSLARVPKGNPSKLVSLNIRNLLLDSLFSLTRNTFPVTAMLYGYTASQFDKLNKKQDKKKEKKEKKEGNKVAEEEVKKVPLPLSDGLSYTFSSLTTQETETTDKKKSQLQTLLSVSMRVIPILRFIPPIYRWTTGRKNYLFGKSESLSMIDEKINKEKIRVENEVDSFVHVHVGESERFYNLWKDGRKSNTEMDINRKETGALANSFPFDEEALTTATRGVLRGLPVLQNNREDKEMGELVLKEKEEKALQSYDPTLIPFGGSKVPFPFMTGSESFGSSIDFMQQLKAPFFQNSNANTKSNTELKMTPTPDKNKADLEESKIRAINQFARPEVSIINSVSVPVPPLVSVQIPGQVPVPTNTIPPLTPIALPKTKVIPSIGLPVLNSTFPFNFPFDSFRGFGGLTLAPAAIRDIREITLTDSDDQNRQGDLYRQSVTGVINNDDSELLNKISGRRAQDLRNRPMLVDTDRVPLPTKADLSLILSRRVAIAVTAALSCQNVVDVDEYIREIGLKSLISAVTENQPDDAQMGESLSIRGIKGICRLIRIDNSVAVKIVRADEVVVALCDAMEAPLKGFRTFRSQVDREKELVAQREAIALVQRIVRSSDAAVEILRLNVRLRKVLSQVAAQGDVFTSPVSVAEQQAGNSLTPPLSSLAANGGRSGSDRKQMEKKKQERKEKKSYANTTVVEYRNQTSHQMARVASWGLGGVQWKGRQPGQKGLRILSFDGGGTRGVLSIAMLKEIMSRISPNEKVQPYELFDIICGTSTGGIIAVLLGAQRRSVGETEALYDEFIDKVFGKKSNLKLVSETAAYDELELEKLLYSMCGDELLLDSNRYDCSRVFCLSTKVNNNPPQAKVWRNYNYPPGQRSRYPGAFRINTVTAVRATSAAPTFFTPVQWEQGLYCDGALVANNPTAIALQEAKVLYPGVPVELVVSIGTGYYNNKEKLRTMGWDLLVNQLIASSTDTEDVHALLNDFLPEEKYFRFNPLLQDLLAIDEKNKAVLLDLKRIAKATFVGMETGEEAKHVEFLINTLRGSNK